MSIMTNHGHYVSFKRTAEEQQTSDIIAENKELKNMLNALQEKVEELASKVDNSSDTDN